MNFFTHIFEGFYLDFKLLFIVLFLGIISWKVVSRFNGGEGLFFRWNLASFLRGGGGAPWERDISFNGGIFEKKSLDGEVASPIMHLPTIGNPDVETPDN